MSDLGFLEFTFSRNAMDSPKGGERAFVAFLPIPVAPTEGHDATQNDRERSDRQASGNSRGGGDGQGGSRQKMWERSGHQ